MKAFSVLLGMGCLLMTSSPCVADEVNDLRVRVERLEKEVRELRYTMQAMESASGDHNSRLLNPKNATAEPRAVVSEGKISDKESDNKGDGQPAVIPAGQITRKELDEATKNLPILLSQARGVPYYKQGEVIGLRLFAIREGTLYDRVGLRNGDVVISANGELVSDPQDVVAIFKTSARREINEIVVLRKGRETRLRYEVLDN